VERSHVAAQPKDVTLFGGQSLVLDPDDLAQPLDCFFRVDVNWGKLARWDKNCPMVKKRHFVLALT
jgi:hypothetical protein